MATSRRKVYLIYMLLMLYLTSTRSGAWVFDTGSVANICNSKQELWNKRRVARHEVTMRVGNGSKVDVIAVGTLPLQLPSGLVLNLNNCYLVPALSMNIISGDRKSTRLNSSHPSISYAVFCLKKKTHNRLELVT